MLNCVYVESDGLVNPEDLKPKLLMNVTLVESGNFSGYFLLGIINLRLRIFQY